MYKAVPSDIKKHLLDSSLYKLHKEGNEHSDFVMDNTSELIDGSFGIYSAVNLKERIGPIKTEYFRIALIRKGTAHIDIGLEKFNPIRNYIIFGFPGQVFSLYDSSSDFFCYYMLFSESFIEDTGLLKNQQQFPFLTYAGVQCFQLGEEEANETEDLISRINEEVKNRKTNMRKVIQLYIQLILIRAQRNYGQTLLAKQGTGEKGENLFNRYLKLVSQHFLKVHKVSDYAGMLHVTADHLNRTIKSYSAKTAHELIDEMILTEAKSYLLHSVLAVSEIAYKLDFSDPSHFNKFFKKLTRTTPQQYRDNRK
ncbi:MAG: helix-turn-helix domain-containing protein [Ferruginibacter sp.]